MNVSDIKQIRQVIKEEVSTSEERIIGQVAKFVSEDIVHQFDEKADKSDIERLERKLDRALDMGVDHESRIKDIGVFL